MMTLISDRKAAIRQEIRNALKTLSPEACAMASTVITDAVLRDAYFRRADVVMAFASLSAEPDLTSLIASAPETEWVFPRVRKEDIALDLYRVRSHDDFEIGSYGIREPSPARCEPVDLDDVELILVPGLGFDPGTGARLGRGGGYYDRLLAAAADGPTDCLLLGVAFDLQLRRDIPEEAHDVRVQGVLTESGLRWL